MTRLFLSALTYLAALALVAAAAIFSVLLIAGPHSDIVPESMKWLVLLVGWVCVLVLPVLVARKVWKRLGKSG